MPASQAASGSSPSGEQGGFTYVTRAPRSSKARKDRRKNGKGGAQETLQDRQEARIAIIEARKKELEMQSALWDFLRKAFPKRASSCSNTSAKADIVDNENVATQNIVVKDVVALGIGSVKDARSAQIQLALLLIICDAIRQGRDDLLRISAYDPICDEEDEALLAAFGIQSLSENKKGCYSFDVPTLVYMPHCPRELYENILRANWTAKRLSNLLLCCNDLERYSTGIAKAQTQSPCLEKIVPHLTVLAVPAMNDVAGNALNDLAVQRFVPKPKNGDLDAKEKGELSTLLDELYLNSSHATLSSDFWVLPKKASESTKSNSDLI